VMKKSSPLGQIHIHSRAINRTAQQVKAE